ncbi:MAG: hypothetical protein ACYTGH_13055 [Planctomycetota bacterium]
MAAPREDFVLDKLKQKMDRNTERVLAKAKESGHDHRIAAYLMAIERVVAARNDIGVQ